MTFLYKIFLLAALAGCSEYEIALIPEDTKPGVVAPEIEVDPVEHSFGALSAGSESSDVMVSIKNIGNDNLDIGDIYLSGGLSTFSFSYLGPNEIEPGDSFDVIITYTPYTFESNLDVLNIASNDTDEPLVKVYLDGTGDAPVIYIDPENYDMGSVYLGCEEQLEIAIGNIGNSNLIIYDLQYYATIPNDFFLGGYTGEYGPLPIVITPGDYIYLDVDYIPIDGLSDSAYVQADSNDPARPRAESAHEAIGEYKDWVTDSFIQDGLANVDILFVVDNSGSMSSNQTNLKNNFSNFINVFSIAGVDYHLALITTDSPNFVGSIISSSSADPISDFEDQVDIIGHSGSPSEKGLYQSFLATSIGGDAAAGSSTGFLRSDAKMVIVYVSDEPDHSVLSSTMSYSDYSAHLLSTKTSSSMIVAHSIVGDYPSGCTTNGRAEFGAGYYEVTNDLGGTSMSICASDWSVTMEGLARDSLAGIIFALSEVPLEETLQVIVDGVVSTDWTFDSSINSIILGSAPLDGSSIDINYAVIGECD
jgi:hypothetical protein